MRTFAAKSILKNLSAIWASNETKALEAAGILADHFGLPVKVSLELHENDRSATGFLPPEEFERTADAFFANPLASVRGWETAVNAQQRITKAFFAIISSHPDGDIAVVAHGGVGTLLLCHLLKAAISRDHDQPFQGHYWAFDLDENSIVHPWQTIG